MQDELEGNQEDFHSLDHEDWCDLLSTIEVKDNRKRSATQIKRLASSKLAYNSESDESIRVPHKKRLRTGVLPNRKQKGVNYPKHHGPQRYCML